MVPFQITFQDFPESDAVWIAAQDRIERLEHYYNKIMRCEVVLSCPHRHRHADRLYHVQIHIVLPGDDIIINRNTRQNEAHRDIYVAIRDSFDAAERKLKEKINKIRHETKHHEDKTEKGKISKIFYNEGFGFLITNNGNECYFAKNSVLNEKFDRLEVGQSVRFQEELGENGPQVTSMTVI